MKQVSPINLRVGKMSDLKVLKHLEQQVVEAERPFNSRIRPGQVQYYDLPDLLSSDKAQVWVAVEEAGGDETIVACGYAQIRASKGSLQHVQHGYLGFMYTHPEYRGQGLNQQIIKELIHWAHQQGVEDFYLDVYAQNQGAIRAYEKAGFHSSMIEMQLTIPQTDTEKSVPDSNKES